jgi:hypothetical protein
MSIPPGPGCNGSVGGTIKGANLPGGNIDPAPVVLAVAIPASPRPVVANTNWRSICRLELLLRGSFMLDEFKQYLITATN